MDELFNVRRVTSPEDMRSIVSEYELWDGTDGSHIFGIILDLEISPDVVMFCAYSSFSGTPIGVSIVSYDITTSKESPERHKVVQVYVGSEYRGFGVGSALVERCVEHFEGEQLYANMTFDGVGIYSRLNLVPAFFFKSIEDMDLSDDELRRKHLERVIAGRNEERSFCEESRERVHREIDDGISEERSQNLRNTRILMR